MLGSGTLASRETVVSARLTAVDLTQNPDLYCRQPGILRRSRVSRLTVVSGTALCSETRGSSGEDGQPQLSAAQQTFCCMSCSWLLFSAVEQAVCRRSVRFRVASGAVALPFTCQAGAAVCEVGRCVNSVDFKSSPTQRDCWCAAKDRCFKSY